MNKLQVGFSRVDITPQTGSFESFRLAPNKRSLGVHDPLYAHALYLNNNGNALLIISIDCVGFSAATTALFQRAIQKVMPLSEEQILLAATHTHNGAETQAEEPLADFSPQISQVRDGVVEAVAQATAKPFSARMGWGRLDVGYIPDSESYQIDTYETTPTLFHRAGKEAGTGIVTKGIELIRALPGHTKGD